MKKSSVGVDFEGEFRKGGIFLRKSHLLDLGCLILFINRVNNSVGFSFIGIHEEVAVDILLNFLAQ